MSMVGRTNDATFNAVFGIFIVGIQFPYYGVAGESTQSAWIGKVLSVGSQNN